MFCPEVVVPEFRRHRLGGVQHSSMAIPRSGCGASLSHRRTTLRALAGDRPPRAREPRRPRPPRSEPQAHDPRCKAGRATLPPGVRARQRLLHAASTSASRPTLQRRTSTQRPATSPPLELDSRKFRFDRPAALMPGCCLPDAATVSLDAPIQGPVPDSHWLLQRRVDSAVWRSRRERWFSSFSTARSDSSRASATAARAALSAPPSTALSRLLNAALCSRPTATSAPLSRRLLACGSSETEQRSRLWAETAAHPGDTGVSARWIGGLHSSSEEPDPLLLLARVAGVRPVGATEAQSGDLRSIRLFQSHRRGRVGGRRAAHPRLERLHMTGLLHRRWATCSSRQHTTRQRKLCECSASATGGIAGPGAPPARRWACGRGIRPAAAGVALAAAGIGGVQVAGSAIAKRRRPARFRLVERVVGGAQ